MAPGRVAAGERFAFAGLHWTTQLNVAGRRLVLERYHLSSDNDSLCPLWLHFPSSYHAAGYVVSPRLPGDRAFLQAIAALSNLSV